MKSIVQAAAVAALVVGVINAFPDRSVDARAFGLGVAAAADAYRAQAAEVDRLDSPPSTAPTRLLSPEDVFALAALYPWPAEEALKIAGCESTLYADADNGRQVGLYQVDFPTHWRRVNGRAELFDPGVNTRVAFDIWAEAGGWAGPWKGCLWALG